jgi:hypothetical protein
VIKEEAPMRKKKTRHGISDEVLDQLLASYSGPDDLTGPEGLLKRLTAIGISPCSVTSVLSLAPLRELPLLRPSAACGS